MRTIIGVLLILFLVPTGYSDVPKFPVEWGEEISCKLVEKGRATYYGIGDGFAGRKTANGEIYTINKFTAAHMKLPMHSVVRVRSGDKQVYVRINDRGPAKWTGNAIDLSPVAFMRLSGLEKGVIPVVIEVCTKEKNV